MTTQYKVVAPWVGGPKKGEILTKAQAEKSGDSAEHLIHTGNIEAVEDAPKAALGATARKRPTRAEQRANKAAKAAQAPVVAAVPVESTTPESK